MIYRNRERILKDIVRVCLVPKSVYAIIKEANISGNLWRGCVSTLRREGFSRKTKKRMLVTTIRGREWIGFDKGDHIDTDLLPRVLEYMHRHHIVIADKLEMIAKVSA